jgi:hypothetical protein
VIPPDVLERVRELLRPRVSGYFPNTIREHGVTCQVCSTPVDGFTFCYRCNQDRSELTADRVGSLAYAWKGAQSGYVMRGYKSTPAADEWVVAIRLLLAVGFTFHMRCLGTLAGQPVGHWASVPSLPAKPGEHPFHRLVREAPGVPGAELRLAAAATTSDPRAFNPAHFTVLDSPAPSAHVLVLDDTWTTGGRAQSVAAALKGAGAGEVSVLTVARWVEPAYPLSGAFIKARLSPPDFDPAVCPWSGGVCP